MFSKSKSGWMKRLNSTSHRPPLRELLGHVRMELKYGRA